MAERRFLASLMRGIGMFQGRRRVPGQGQNVDHLPIRPWESLLMLLEVLVAEPEHSTNGFGESEEAITKVRTVTTLATKRRRKK